jgi:hypothetical protein
LTSVLSSVYELMNGAILLPSSVYELTNGVILLPSSVYKLTNKVILLTCSLKVCMNKGIARDTPHERKLRYDKKPPIKPKTAAYPKVCVTITYILNRKNNIK